VSGVTSLRIFLQRFIVAFVVAAVISGAVMAGANVIENQKLSGIDRIKLPNNLLAPSKPGAPANYLIIGSDSRKFVDTPAEAKAFGSDAEIGNARSDVMMVVHVVPSLGTAYVVSFPRDTYVNIPGYGMNKLNAAFAFGGPALTIKTFQEDFGIPIQHYLAVNFIGFQNIVTAIGHVKIYFPTPARDFFTGLDEPVAGCQSLNGVQALEYARSRHYLIPADGVSNPDPNNRSDWIEDPREDLDRIKRQQYFLRSLGQTALNHGASNPNTALHLADAISNSLTADKTLSNRDLKALVRAFRGFDPATVEMTTIPITVDGSQLVLQYPEAQAVIDRLKDLAVPVALPQPVKPSKIKVVVVDGSGVKGRAQRVQAKLAARGFHNGGVGDASEKYAKTQVRYAPGEVAKGLTLGLYLGTLNVVEAASTSVQLGSKKLDGDVIVVIGRDFPKLHGLLARPVPTTTTSNPSGNTGTGNTTASTTTSTTPVTTPDTRYVPVGKGLAPLVGCP
jgi:polyisoprenyl-teichoic acid--peptidoglycan teichoic acid transferase